MRPKHASYSWIPEPSCQCRNSLWSPGLDDDAAPLVASYTETKVEILCGACQRLPSTFYRKPELEAEPTRADKSFIGLDINVKRFVAWVGYAKNTSTVFWSEMEEQDRIVKILAREIDISTEKAIAVLASRTLWHDWLVNAIAKRARFEMFGEAFKSQPVLPARGLWFMDFDLTVTIQGVLRIITGKRDGGYIPSSSWDREDYEPPCLYNQVHHKLYYGHFQGQNVLIYPDDVEEK